MNRNQVLPKIALSSEPHALQRVDFCSPQTYPGEGFLSIADLPRLAEEASTVGDGDGFHWQCQTHFDHPPSGRPKHILNLALKGRMHLVCQRCLKDCSVAIDEKRQFLLVASEEEAEAYPIEDDLQEPLVASHQFDLLETIEDEVLLSLPLIPKHPDGACNPPASILAPTGSQLTKTEGVESRENPFNVLKDMKKKL